MKKVDFRDFRGHLRRNIEEIKYSIQERHIKRTTVALLLTIPYLLSEWTARAYDLYAAFPVIDNFVHATFGIAFASIAYLIYNKTPRKIIFMAFIVSLIWEVYEVLGDYLPAGSRILDPLLYDGIKDILVTFIFAVISAYTLSRFVKRNYFRITVD
jgi:hypothetical protein